MKYGVHRVVNLITRRTGRRKEEDETGSVVMVFCPLPDLVLEYTFLEVTKVNRTSNLGLM